jgi:hypothetical protein
MKAKLLILVSALIQLSCTPPAANIEPQPAAVQTEPTTHPLVSKIARILQPGWDVLQNGNIILVTRHEPVSTYGNVAMPPNVWRVMTEAKPSLKYQITIEIGEIVPKPVYQKLLAINKETELALSRTADKMRDFRSKANYSPKSDSERKLYEEYRRELRELPYHRLPDLYDDRHSYYVTTPRHLWQSFVYKREERECRAVLENIFSLADAYGDFNDKTAERESFDYRDDQKVENAFESGRDYDTHLLVKQNNLPELK